MLTGFAAPRAARTATEIADLAGAAPGVRVNIVMMQVLKVFRLQDRAQSLLDYVTDERVRLMVGIAGKRLARWFYIEILAESATGERMKAVFDEFHGVGVGTEGFGCGWFVPVPGATQGQQRTEAGAPDAKASCQFSDKPTGIALDIGGAHDTGEREFGWVVDG